jgi:WD40 repeat protein
MFSLGDDWKAIEWDPQSGRQRRLLFPMPSSPKADARRGEPLNISLNGNCIVFVDWQLSSMKCLPGLQVWDTLAGKEICNLGGKSTFNLACFSPEGKLLATTSDGIAVWQIRTGKRLDQFPQRRGP